MAVQSGIRDARKKKTTDEIIQRNKRLREYTTKSSKTGIEEKSCNFSHLIYFSSYMYFSIHPGNI
jgi:hypothetical protein